MPYRLKTYCNLDKATHVARPRRRAVKRLRLKDGDRSFQSLWICNHQTGPEFNRCYHPVMIGHIAPLKKKDQPAAMRRIREFPMVCPKCCQPLTFLGFLPQDEFLEPWEPAQSKN